MPADSFAVAAAKERHHSQFERIAAEHERIGAEHAAKRAELEAQHALFESTSEYDRSIVDVRVDDY